ncbi:hypothetical protein ACF0H5_000716 [Mactra antiquata]
MENTTLYVPNYQKWKKYYEDIVDNDKRTDQSEMNELYDKTVSTKNNDSNISLNLVSPVKMLTEQAKSDIERNESDETYKLAFNEKLVQKKKNSRRVRSQLNKRRRKPKRQNKTNPSPRVNRIQKQKRTKASRKQNKQRSEKKDIFH